jgi:hypothetical protein
MTDLDLEIEQYREAIRKNPKDVYAHYNLGHALDRMFILSEQPEMRIESKEHYYLAIKLDEDFFEALTNLATILLKESIHTPLNIDAIIVEEAVQYLERAKKIGKNGEEGFLPFKLLAYAYFWNGRASSNASLLLSAKKNNDYLEEAMYSNQTYWEQSAEILVELALAQKDFYLLKSAADKYWKAIELGMDLNEFYCRRLVDGYRMIRKLSGEPAIMVELIDHMVDVASEALSKEVIFSDTQKGLIQSMSGSIGPYTHELQQTIGKSAPELLMPLLVLMHHQKELLAG